MKPARVPYLRHNLARFNRDTDHRARKRTPWLGLCALVVWSAALWYVSRQECEYHRQRERALAPIETTVAGDSEALSHVSDAGVEVTPTRGSISFTF